MIGQEWLQGVECRRFSGYKPCEPGRLCGICREPEGWGKRVLLVSLEALGAVIQTTSVLAPMQRKWAPMTLIWVTMPWHLPVLENNPYVFEALPYNFETVEILRQQRFDIAINLDKTRRGAALLQAVTAERKMGFALSPNGQIIPANGEAEYLYRLGLDDDLKFRRNSKPGAQLIAEALGLEWRRDPYVLRLAEHERAEVYQMRHRLGIAETVVVGFNTGSSAQFPHKSLTIEQHISLLRLTRDECPDAALALLGGEAESERNRQIASAVKGVLETPTTGGLRCGLQAVAMCDVVVTGDTAALHMAIGLGRYAVAWFGLSCAAEIDVYDWGEKIISPLPCAPCWKKECPDPRCVRTMDLNAIVAAIRRGVEAVRKQRQEAKVSPAIKR